ncbi:MAG: ABC transporter ATP-binding protein [Bacteroidales bacterium]
MSRENSIVISQLSKSYGKVKALNGVDLSIRSGELFGLIGADGAGKTTLFEILATLIRSDGGSAQLATMDVQKQKKGIRSVIGYMPGRFSLYQDLSVKENLQFYATIFGTTIDAGYELIAPIWDQIAPFSDRPAGKLSGGMKQKLALCCALVHKPLVLLLDEPTTGVDPVSRREFWDMLKSLREKGITQLVSTPYMDEAVRCDRIAFLHEGDLLAVDTPEGFVRAYQGEVYAVQSEQPYSVLKQLEGLTTSDSCYMFGREIHWTLSSKENATEILRENGIQYSDIEKIVPTVEDCFMQLMKGGRP